MQDMTIKELGQPEWFSLRLGPGADLFQGLRDFFMEKKLRRAYVVSTIGSLEKAIFNYPVTGTRMPPPVKCKTVEKFLEINGISGEIWPGEAGIRVHLHGSCTHEGDAVYGGGMADGAKVLVQAEMLIMGYK
jgi:predicted DNA-binding protein with PD1-like motif